MYDAESLGRASRRRRNGRVVFLNTSHWDVSLSDTLDQRRDIGKHPNTAIKFMNRAINCAANIKSLQLITCTR